MATFHDIIGQEQIKEHLQNAISAKKISHAYIINGEKSSGKEFIARVICKLRYEGVTVNKKLTIPRPPETKENDNNNK